MRVARFWALGGLALLAGGAGCGSRPRAGSQNMPATSASAPQRAECSLCGRTPPWHEQEPSVDPSCSGTRIIQGGDRCSQIARTRIARTTEVHGQSSNDVLALYEGVHRAPFYWTGEHELDCPDPSEALSSTMLEVAVRRSSRCSEQLSCFPGEPSGPLYVPVAIELRTEDGRIEERFESFLAAGHGRARLSDAMGQYSVIDGRDEKNRKMIELAFEHDGRRATIRGSTSGWGPQGSFPVSCLWRCMQQPKLADLKSRLEPAKVFGLLAAQRLATKTAQPGFPITLEASPVGQHACLPHAGEFKGEPPGSYIIPAQVALRAADGALIARLRLEIIVKPAGCATCPSVSLRGTAPLEYPALVAQEDGRKVVAHVALDLEMAASTAKARATLRLSYIDRQGAERLEKYELETR